MKKILTIILVCWVTCIQSANAVEFDNEGRQIIWGPIDGTGLFLENVHIISNSVGVETSGPFTIKNSIITANTCIVSPGQDLGVINVTLDCNLGVYYTSGILINNTLVGNRYNNRLTNR